MVFITTIFLGALMPGFIAACLKRDSANQKNDSIRQTLIEEDEKDSV